MQRTRPRTLNHSLQDLDVLMHNSKLYVRSCAGSFSVLYCPLYCSTLIHNTTYVIITHQRTSTYSIYSTISIRLSFSLLIILYCLFIVPECSTTLFVHMSMSSALVLLCWMPAACLFVCLLVANGDIGLSPHI